MKIRIDDNEVDLCRSCEKNYEACDAYEKDYIYGSNNNNVCCCAKYVPDPTGGES